MHLISRADWERRLGGKGIADTYQKKYLLDSTGQTEYFALRRDRQRSARARSPR